MVVFLIAIILGVAAYLAIWPVPIEPIVWTPGPDAGFNGVFATNQHLAKATKFQPDFGLGPEDITQDDQGYFYTGMQDGRIIRFDSDGTQRSEFTNTGGRPLGMQFDAQGQLIVADAFKGLLSIDPKGKVTTLVYEVEGKPMLFTDDLDIASDGTIWFSDASQRFDQHNYMLDFLEGQSTGRLLSYEPATQRTTVHLENMQFANGVALGPDEAYLLVNETYAARIYRYWIKGPKKGTKEVFIEGLPGYPDNLSYNGRDTFWVALPAPRATPLEKMAGRPFLRKVVARLPEFIRNSQVVKMGWVIGIDHDGQVKYNFQENAGHLSTITSVNEFDGYLYLGSIAMNTVARISKP